LISRGAPVPLYIADLACTPTKKILGGQLNASLAWPVYVHVSADASATITGTANGVNVDQTRAKSDTATHYQNGIDMHTDWGASKFLHFGKSHRIWQACAAGYYYQHLTGDSGSGTKLGDFKGRVVGLGGQFGIIHKFGPSWEVYLNVRTYGEFATQHRTSGFVMFITYVIPTRLTLARRRRMHKGLPGGRQTK
jgi:hypothetical protein